MRGNSVYGVLELLEGDVLTCLENCEDLPQSEIDRLKEKVWDLVEDINVTVDERENGGSGGEPDECDD